MSLCAIVFRMSVYDQITELLRRYVVAHVDQLCEAVVDWDDMSSVAGSEESGCWVHAQIWVTYVVHPDVEPRRGIPNFRTYHWDATATHMIRELERMANEGSI
jgi:hypothetical protein